MINISRIPVSGRRHGVGVGLAAGAGLAVAALAMGSAHADSGVGLTDPAAALTSAAADLSQANDVWSGVNVPASLQQFFDSQTPIPDHYAQLITQAESIQDPLLSSDNSAVSDLANLLFGNLDEQFTRDSAALLSAEHAFIADPSQVAEVGLLTADLHLAGTALDSLFPDLAGVFIDRLLGIDVGMPDLAIGLGPDLFF